MQTNTIHILACHQNAPITIPTISAITTDRNIQLILDVRATPGGGKQKNLSKKKLKKFFSGPTESNYVWDKTLSNRRKISEMTPEILTSHAIRVLGSTTDVLLIVDHFHVVHQMVTSNLAYSFVVIEFPDPTDVFSHTERPFDVNVHVDAGVSPPRHEEKEGRRDEALVHGPQLTDVPRFTLGDDFETDGMAFLEENGFVVIANVLSEGDIAHGKNLLWNHLEGLGSGINRRDVETWNNENWPDRQPSGVVAWQGIGQSPFVWFIRGRPNVRAVFETALHSDTLVTSFDGCGVFRPWQYEKSWLTKKSWIHVDQNPAFAPEFECLQGLVTLTDANESTGGFMCIPKSHKEFLNFYERNRVRNKRMQKTFSDRRKMLVRLPEDDVLMNEQRIIPRLFAGDMILWDSRTMHCNSHALDMSISDEVYNRGVSEWDLIRIVCYTCMSTPEMIVKKGGDLETIIRKREHAARNQVTTNHMPFIFNPNGDGPDRRGGKKPLRTPALPPGFELTEEQWRLVRGM